MRRLAIVNILTPESLNSLYDALVATVSSRKADKYVLLTFIIIFGNDK